MQIKMYFNRFGGYILLSMSLALILGPFHGNPFNGSSPYQHDFFRYIIAGCFFTGGILLIRKTFKTLPGIALNPRWSHILADGIIIIFLSIMAYGVFSYGLKKIAHITPYLYDSISMGMMTIAYIPVTILFVIFSSQFGESIEINKNGIRIHSAERTKTLPWEDIRGFNLKNTYIIAGNANFSAPRRMQTKLVIHTQHEHIELSEPGLKYTKKKIIRELKKTAPDQLKGAIDPLISTW